MFLPDPAPCGPACLSPSSALGVAERGVVLLARHDSRRFGWDAGLPRTAVSAALRRAFSAITGIEPVPALADARLERLRLFACMMRRGDGRAGALAETLLADGFSEGALREAVHLALG